MGRGAGWVIVHGVSKESGMTEQLNNNNKVCCRRISVIRLVHTSSTSYRYLFFPFVVKTCKIYSGNNSQVYITILYGIRVTMLYIRPLELSHLMFMSFDQYLPNPLPPQTTNIPPRVWHF